MSIVCAQQWQFNGGEPLPCSVTNSELWCCHAWHSEFYQHHPSWGIHFSTKRIFWHVLRADWTFSGPKMLKDSRTAPSKQTRRIGHVSVRIPVVWWSFPLHVILTKIFAKFAICHMHIICAWCIWHVYTTYLTNIRYVTRTQRPCARKGICRHMTSDWDMWMRKKRQSLPVCTGIANVVVWLNCLASCLVIFFQCFLLPDHCHLRLHHHLRGFFFRHSLVRCVMMDDSRFSTVTSLCAPLFTVSNTTFFGPWLAFSLLLLANFLWSNAREETKPRKCFDAMMPDDHCHFVLQGIQKEHSTCGQSVCALRKVPRPFLLHLLHLHRSFLDWTDLSPMDTCAWPIVTV